MRFWLMTALFMGSTTSGGAEISRAAIEIPVKTYAPNTMPSHSSFLWPSTLHKSENTLLEARRKTSWLAYPPSYEGTAIPFASLPPLIMAEIIATKNSDVVELIVDWPKTFEHGRYNSDAWTRSGADAYCGLGIDYVRTISTMDSTGDFSPLASWRITLVEERLSRNSNSCERKSSTVPLVLNNTYSIKQGLESFYIPADKSNHLVVSHGYLVYPLSPSRKYL